MRDEVKTEYESEDYSKLMTATSFDDANSKAYRYSQLLKEYFGVSRTPLPYPTILRFLTEGGKITHFRNIPLKGGSTEKAFASLRSLFSTIATVLEVWHQSGQGDSSALWTRIKDVLLEAGYTIYIKERSETNLEASVSELSKFVE